MDRLRRSQGWEVYDNRLPAPIALREVVAAMVRLTDEALEGTLGRPYGFASPDVTVVDPATGTGTFLLGVSRQIGKAVETDRGAGAVPGAMSDAARRLIGFELQFGPFAVAQLRLVAEFQELMGSGSPGVPALRLFVTDTLGNP